MRSAVLLCGLLILFCLPATKAQRMDTLRMMQYNLLNYRNTTTQCNGQTNDPAVKEAAIREIAAYAKPDLIAVNEMGANWLNADKLLTNALNKSGYAHYDQAQFSNNSFSELTNMLFYNTEKLVYHSQQMIDKDPTGKALVRVIDIYRIYMNDEQSLLEGDTVFFNIAVAHLKAGSTVTDQSEREEMAEGLMAFMKDKRKAENYILCGDFNIQSSSEACYQTFTTQMAEDIRFYDPADAPGNWSGKSIFSNLHTQSTRTSSTSGGCFSGGGLDDRFDFILVGQELLGHSNGAKFINGTYRVLGQDSRRFDQTVLNPENNSVPLAVAQALYNASDHLPVLIDLAVGPLAAEVDNGSMRASIDIEVSRGMLHVRSLRQEEFSVQIRDLHGRLLVQEGVANDRHIQLRGLSGGIYLLYVVGKSGHCALRFPYVAD